MNTIENSRIHPWLPCMFSKLEKYYHVPIIFSKKVWLDLEKYETNTFCDLDFSQPLLYDPHFPIHAT